MPQSALKNAMPGKQAKTLNDSDLRKVLARAARGRHSQRDQVMVLLSVKAGLRACEIAGLTWAMVLDARGKIGPVIETRDAISKGRRGRTIPMNKALAKSLEKLRRKQRPAPHEPIVRSERGKAMRANSIVNWFAVVYRKINLEGCSSHSGRRTFITKAARLVYRVGGSLRDVQQLAGHASIEMTQRYIDGNEAAKRALVQLI